AHAARAPPSNMERRLSSGAPRFRRHRDATRMKSLAARSRSIRNSTQGISVGAIFFFACAVVFTVTLLAATSKFLPRPWQVDVLPDGQTVPVAMIQLPPDSSGRCRTLLFHNDKRSVEEGGMGRCHALIPDEMLVWTTRDKAALRNEALSRAFKFR